MIRRQTFINLILCATGCIWGWPNWFGLIPVILTVIVLSVSNGLSATSSTTTDQPHTASCHPQYEYRGWLFADNNA